MAEHFIDALNEYFENFIENRFNEIEENQKEKEYTIPILSNARSICPFIYPIHFSITTAPDYSYDYDPYSLSGILSRITPEGAERKMTTLKIRFDNIWRWISKER